MDPLFLYYALANPKVVGWVRGHAIGATMPNLNTAILFEVPLRVPKYLETQRRIASILMAYDNLIENNRKQIALLEEAAQRLYKEWFVDLRFPGHEDVEVVDGLPQGWSAEVLTECCDAIRGKSYTSADVDGDGDAVLVNLKNLRPFGGWNAGAERVFSGTFKDEQRVASGDIVMGVTDMTKERRLVGRVALVPKLDGDAVISMDLVKLQPINVNRLYLYAVLRYSGIAEAIASLANGTNVLHLKPQMLSSVRIACPPLGLQERFGGCLQNYVSEIELAMRQIANLSEARDRLLPRLISGEIGVI